jgi:TfoX/Sxy family transcriptional regulator of competence genes
MARLQPERGQPPGCPKEGRAMQIPRPSETDKEYFRSLLPDSPDVEIKPMFANLGAFVNGNMFAGLFGPAVGVRLADSDRDELAAIDGSGPFGPAERPMGGYLSLPLAWRDQPGTAADWMDKALLYVRTFPPKQKKPAKKR